MAKSDSSKPSQPPRDKAECVAKTDGMSDAEFDRWVEQQGGQPVSKKLWEKQAIDLPLPERVSLAQRLWESIEYGLTDAEENSVIAEAVRRDGELTAGVVVGREHSEVMRVARQRLGCG